MRKKGWDFAAKLMDYWFTGRGGVYFVDLNEMQNKFPIIKEAVEKYENDAKNNYLGSLESKYLVDILKNTNNSKGKNILEDGGSINFIEKEMNLIGANLQWYPEIFDEYEKTYMNWIGEQALSHWKLDEYTAAFSNAVIRLLTNVQEVSTIYGYPNIFISELGIYLRDSYDFYDDNSENISDTKVQ